MTNNKLDEICKILANNNGMPYCWEEIKNRLLNGIKLPFKVFVDTLVIP